MTTKRIEMTRRTTPSRCDKPRARPIFVIGAQRSGASLLALSLTQHPAIVPVQDSTWVERFAIDLHHTYADATADTTLSRIAARGVDRSAFYAEFGNAIDRLLVGDGPATRWLDAAYTNAFIAAVLARFFPNGRFIHVLRDVGSVVASLTSDANKQAYRSRYIKLTPRDAYEHWLDVVTACIEAEHCLGSATVLRIRRDDLVHHPECTLRRCLDFLDEPFDPACLRPFVGRGDLPPCPQLPDHPVDPVLWSQAEVLSRTLLCEGTPTYPADPLWRARLDDAFTQRAESARTPIPEPAPSNPTRT